MLRRRSSCCCLVLGLTLVAGVAGAASDEEELALAYGDEAMVSIATGRQQALSRVPAVATVITARDIEAMGATELEQVLASVPGLHVSVGHFNYNAIYAFRGIFTGYNSQVLMLVNGIPINNVFLGNRGIAWGGMPLANVARIEIIRGPGSALYGADAYAGVINVITRTAEDIKGSEAGVRAGSFGTREGWIQHGSSHGSLHTAFYLQAGHSDGHRRIIEQDQQSQIDAFVGSSASLAPGPVNLQRDSLDARADIALDRWRLRAAYQSRELGSGAGLAESLDPWSRIPVERLFLDLSFQDASFAPHWDLSAVIGFFDVKEEAGDTPFMLFPPGADFRPLGGDLFPNGVIGNAGHAERHTHANVSAFYSGFERHRLRIGGGYRMEDLYETTESKNFRLTLDSMGNPVFAYLGDPPIDVSGTPDIYLTPHRREVAYVFTQDEWDLAKDWTLTAGVRFDHYSDFGDTTNPRLALVWDAAYNVVVKALYGRAFRAPSFAEQYNQNNPVTLGNPCVEPETIDTGELVLVWQPAGDMQASLSLFHYRMQDIIRFLPGANPSAGVQAQNAGEQSGRGAELEGRWDATRDLRFTGNVSLQHAIDEATGQDAGLAPRQRYFVQADWRFAPLWQFGGTVNHVADRKRQPGDSRPEIADYTTLDLTVRREKVVGNLEVRALALNVFDVDAREPSLAPGRNPNDLPLAGRSFYLQMQYEF
ncbi:MAG: TonB-dependent receptor [Moraxellaceae bacterium]|jgi:iron complex outermembrane receptor protein|nr:TonB-dependent receptor [Moraxellaceae bacterium]